MRNNSVTWILEGNIFAGGDCLLEGARRAGHRVLNWNDDWWENQEWPVLSHPAVFHGSLENAHRVRNELPWNPGSYCNTPRFLCSHWYPLAQSWLLHKNWKALTVSQLVNNKDQVLEEFGGQQVFVRPDSPLKPFSGRVLSRDSISLAALDFGFYYDDPELPIVVAPVRKVTREWRYVVAGRSVVAGSAYLAEGRAAIRDTPHGSPWELADRIAKSIDPPDDVYVLDLCEADDGMHLLELNPFSGADLYACDGNAIVDAITHCCG